MDAIQEIAFQRAGLNITRFAVGGASKVSFKHPSLRRIGEGNLFIYENLYDVLYDTKIMLAFLIIIKDSEQKVELKSTYRN